MAQGTATPNGSNGMRVNIRMKWVTFPRVEDNTTEISLPTPPPDISTCFPRRHQDPLNRVQDKNTGYFIKVSKVFCVKLYKEIRNDKEIRYHNKKWTHTMETKQLEKKNLSHSSLPCIFLWQNYFRCFIIQCTKCFCSCKLVATFVSTP